MSDFAVAGLIVLALAAVSNLGNSDTLSMSCRGSDAWVTVCR